MKQSTLIIGGVVVVVVAVVLWLLLKPSPGQDKDCFTIKYDQLAGMLPSGWNDPNNPDHVMAFSFHADKSSGVKITVSPVGRDGQPIVGKGVDMEVSNPDRCKLPDNLALTDNVYILETADADQSGRLFSFQTLRALPKTAEDGSTISYDLEFANGGTLVKAAKAKPCPPYCPRPLD